MGEELKLLKAQEADQAEVLRKTRERLDALVREEDAKRLEPLKATAERAHALLCPYNHTDGCSWGYEDEAPDPWRAHAHARWLRHIEALVVGDAFTRRKTTLVEYNILLDAIEEVKAKVPTALSLLRSSLTP